MTGVKLNDVLSWPKTYFRGEVPPVAAGVPKVGVEVTLCVVLLGVPNPPGVGVMEKLKPEDVVEPNVNPDVVVVAVALVVAGAGVNENPGPLDVPEPNPLVDDTPNAPGLVPPDDAPNPEAELD